MAISTLTLRIRAAIFKETGAMAGLFLLLALGTPAWSQAVKLPAATNQAGKPVRRSEAG